MATKPAMHGRDHCPTGSDPIPCWPAGQWARRRQLNNTDQTITTATSTNVTLTNFLTSSASTFAAYDAGSIDGIKILQDGLYSVNFRLWWSTWPGNHVCWIEGVDDPSFAAGNLGFAMVDSNIGNDNLNLAGSFTARLAVNQIIYLIVRHAFGSDRALEGIGGTYMEIVQLATGLDMTERRGF